MKYRIGDKTLLGEIVDVDESCKSRISRPYRVERNGIIRFFTESEIDKIICEPTRPVPEPPHAEESEVVKAMRVVVRRKFEEGER